MTHHITCGIEGCPCGDRGPGNPWRGACGKAKEAETAAGWLAKDIERAQKRCAEWRDDPLERTPPVRGYQPSHHRKASNMGFGALTVGEEARGVSEAAAAKADCGCGNTMRALKGRVRALMEENVRLEARAERALEMLSQPWHRPDRVRAILRGDA